MCCSNLDPIVKCLERNWFVICVYGLERICLLTSCSLSWKETSFLPDLPMVLKEVFLSVFLTMSLTRHHPFLLWRICRLSQGSWKDSTYVCFVHSCPVCWLGSWKEFQCMFSWWLICHLHLGSWKESTSIAFSFVCFWLGSWKESLCMYT